MNFLLQENQLTISPGRVSVEDVLSGRGLVNVYQYFAHKNPQRVNPEITQAIMDSDAVAVVSDAALSKTDP